MRVLTLVHRWLGILFCLLFAMWFASGAVMHFVPFPRLTEADRFAGLAAIGPTAELRSPAEAAAAVDGVARVRLLRRVDGLVYLVSGSAGVKALDAADMSDAAVGTEGLALAIATDHARRRNMDVTRAARAETLHVDQWTVGGVFDRHRPLYRVALGDAAGTDLYVSSTTGEVVGETTRHQRGWNYVGSIAHWIYPTVLRSHAGIWNSVMWWLSLAALTAALTGSLLGIATIGRIGSRRCSRHVAWRKWHHRLGLGCMIFVLSWIFSGWLSMDSGRLFSTGAPGAAEAARFYGMPLWSEWSKSDWRPSGMAGSAKEIEWLALNGRLFRRERTGLDAQRLLFPGSPVAAPFLTAAEIDAAVGQLAAGCTGSFVVAADDNHVVRSPMPGAPVYRSICGDVWWDVDGATGVLMARSDPSSRAYRWLYRALHEWDIPALEAQPALRSALILLTCGFGFLFSLTGMIIGWRRLRRQFSRATQGSG